MSNSFLRTLSTISPWVTLLLLILMFHLIGGSLTTAKGVIFELPETGLAEGESTELVAVVTPMTHETLVFFDDARYFAGDDNSMINFSEHLAERLRENEHKTLLVLADRRVAGGDLMKIAAQARKGGAKRILFAEKRGGEQ